jgi:UDP-sugar pyrophosphorylase
MPQEKALLAQLLEAGQAHLFSSWPAPGTADADKRRMVQQLAVLDAHYHGGLTAYISNAKTLLQDSKEGEARANDSSTDPAFQGSSPKGVPTTPLPPSLPPSLPCPAGRNPFAGYTPKVPFGERLDFGSEEHMELEAEGLKEAGHAAFVLVAGGLGERLGYSGGLQGARPSLARMHVNVWVASVWVDSSCVQEKGVGG